METILYNIIQSYNKECAFFKIIEKNNAFATAVFWGGILGGVVMRLCRGLTTATRCAGGEKGGMKRVSVGSDARCWKAMHVKTHGWLLS